MTAARVNSAVAAFNAADTVTERLTALDDKPPRPSTALRVATYAPALVISAVILATLGSWAGEARHVLAMASHCP